MSLVSAPFAQNTTHFHWTQEIWNQAWHSDDGFSMKSLCAKVACIVFPIIFSVALVEGVLWAGRSIFKISSDPKTDPLDPGSVKKALQESSNKKTEQEEGVKEGNEQQKKPNPIVDRVKTPDLAPVNSDERLGINPTVKVANVNDNAVKNPNIITVALNTGSSQHDIVRNIFDRENQRPPACAFHVLKAIYSISNRFEAWEKHIKDRNSEELSEYQRDMIQIGTRNYFDALTINPCFKESVDLENIKLNDAGFLLDNHLYLKQTNHDPKPVAERVQVIIEHLFIKHEDPVDIIANREIFQIIFKNFQIAFLKNGNGQSIGLVCDGKKTIVFNSHINEITMTIGKKATQAYLTEILGPFANMKNGVDQNPFSYALGQFNANQK